MIRLPGYLDLSLQILTLQNLTYEARLQTRQGGHRLRTPFHDREESNPEVHLREIGSDAAAYLRVAHIYMLISMPTDTSTIFGVFQAIWHSFWYRTNSALGDKVLRIEKFAN
jgi:hypothetical protein